MGSRTEKYHGSPCGRCGGTFRYKNGNCIACMPAHSQKWRDNNPDGLAKSRKKWRDNNPDYHKKHLYGVDDNWVDEQLKRQNNKCAICGTDKPPGRGWQIDHDHVTGAARGILCLKCNTGLGSFDDSIENLKLAVRYLEMNKTVDVGTKAE